MTTRVRLTAVLLWLLLWLPGLVVPFIGHGLGLLEQGAVLALSLFALLLPLPAFSRLRHYFFALTPLAVLVPPYVFLCFYYRSVPGDVLVSAALNTEWRATLGLVLDQGARLLWIPAYLAVYLGLAWRVPASVRLTAGQRKGVLAGLLVYAAVGMLGRQDLAVWVRLPPLFQESTANLVFPANLALSVQRTLAHQRTLAEANSLAGRPAPGTSAQPALIVLVVGESVRPDHLGLMGYPRNTTPWLTSRSAEWLAFQDVMSTAQWTAVAVPQLLTLTGQHGVRGTLVQTFTEAGFQTAWLSNQEPTPMSRAADVVEHSRHDVDFHFRKDTDLLPLFESFVRQGRPRQFVLLHMMGSHFPYEERYERHQRRFTPTLSDAGVSGHPGPAFRDATINSYDNTLVALDQFLERVVAVLARESRPVLLLYVSDHGENLFDDERQRFMHAHPDASRWDLRVPLLVWRNPAYERWRPEVWPALQARLRLPVGHRDVAPTLLDLAGVEWSGRDASHSLASPTYATRPRPMFDLLGRIVGDADAVR